MASVLEEDEDDGDGGTEPAIVVSEASKPDGLLSYIYNISLDILAISHGSRDYGIDRSTILKAAALAKPVLLLWWERMPQVLGAGGVLMAEDEG